MLNFRTTAWLSLLCVRFCALVYTSNWVLAIWLTYCFMIAQVLDPFPQILIPSSSSWAAGLSCHHEYFMAYHHSLCTNLITCRHGRHWEVYSDMTCHSNHAVLTSSWKETEYTREEQLRAMTSCGSLKDQFNARNISWSAINAIVSGATGDNPTIPWVGSSWSRG